LGSKPARKGEIKNEGESHDVVENKWWKNVGFLATHDVDENTSTYTRYPTMFMKTNGLVRG
jgi:hypothetical protein